MTNSQVIGILYDHSIEARETPTGQVEGLVRYTYTGSTAVSEEWETVPNTVKALRDWLGY